jgi:hypothetical protein
MPQRLHSSRMDRGKILKSPAWEWGKIALMTKRKKITIGVVSLMLVAIGSASFYWIHSLISEANKGVQPLSKEHDAAYQSKLRYYAEILKPTMTRNQVEDYLDSRAIKYTKNFCCIDEQSTAILVELGKEKPPWYCSEYGVYLVLHFSAPYSRQSMSREGGQDLLREITTYKWLTGCL